MRAPRNQFSEADFRKRWDSMVDYLADMRDLNITGPSVMRPSRFDDSGEPMCTDCGVIAVREEGYVCMGCKIDHAQAMRGDD